MATSRPSSGLRVLTRGQHPLREGILATIQLPADLTKKEAKRLAVFIESLALEEPAQQLALPRGDVSAAYVGAEQLVIGHVQPGAGRRQTAGCRAVPITPSAGSAEDVRPGGGSCAPICHPIRSGGARGGTPRSPGQRECHRGARTARRGRG